MHDSLETRTELRVGSQSYAIHKLSELAGAERLPYSLKILLENLLRFEDGVSVTRADIQAVLDWDARAEPSQEIAFRPARVLMQDFTGVPAVVDLAAMRDAMRRLGGDPDKINPLQPAELVIDHSVQVDRFGSDDAFQLNAELEYSRNRERYAFLKWGQKAFSNFKVVPPDTGIVHQVNLEYLARTVFTRTLEDGNLEAYPDTVVGTDSHTTMINGLGVLGWGVGGIEAEAAMLGQPISMLLPQVVGFRLTGALPEGATATDLVLTVVEMLRKHGVVGKFVEFFGDGLAQLPLADRATISNMAPEYGATCGIFPIDEETLRYLTLSGRDADQVALTEAYARAQGMFYSADMPIPDYSDILTLDLATVEPSLAGPKRPQDRIALSRAKQVVSAALEDVMRARMAAFASRRDAEGFETEGGHAAVGVEHQADDPARRSALRMHLKDGMVVIAAITSCTNTSNPSVMLAAGLVARKARERGLCVQPWVKTSLAPGSRVVTAYLDKAGLSGDLAALGFDLVGYGCTTCIGNSGPLPEPVSEAIRRDDLTVCSVLSGNRNFEGRVHSEVRMNFLASPPLVVAYALAGRMDIDLFHEPLGEDQTGHPVYLRDVWPSHQEIQDAIGHSVTSEQFTASYDDVFAGEARWQRLDAPDTALFAWQDDSTYVQNPPYFDDIDQPLAPVGDILGARVLAHLGDSVTTDHISPAGSIKADSPAGRYLVEHGVAPADFNSYGSRRGNHEVMMRGTFANIRLRNRLVPGVEGGVTRHLPSGEQTSIYEAAMRYKAEQVPTVIIAGREYGSGSSRDWAAKGPRLLGVRAVLVESFERIHRSNLVGMGVLPLQFMAGENAEMLGLSGEEVYDITGLGDGSAKQVTVTATAADGTRKSFQAKVRIDTPQEIEYYRHGGILPYVLRQLAA
ncbi:aconitate hydratase 1 [Acidihalobacter aeolianus]|uniref:Aconitate hydratase n=1 Tax=Acidihalobacter aeolianus TaxID=2792603 RepID=A0A1D8K7K3_9GAMM|nr:aconitate hydratase AcnA [Acidihalobacter aeolianus]AOV16951.1 aconitate hydratase 1 [Acidihalobacter aeolianus]